MDKSECKIKKAYKIAGLISPPSVRRMVRSKPMRKALRRMRALGEPKQRGKTKHPSWRCLLVVLVALISGLNYVKDAAKLARAKRGQFAAFFGDPGWEAPSYPTLLRAIHRMAEAGHSAKVEAILLGILGAPKGGCQIDGKLIRATRVEGEANSAVDCVELMVGGRVVMSVPCGKGSKEASENAAIMRVVLACAHEIRASGGVLTIDGIAANSKITSALSRLGIPFCIVLKKGGKGLEAAVADNFAAYGGELVGRGETVCQGGRVERRDFYALPSMKWVWAVCDGKPWEGVGGAGMMKKSWSRKSGGAESDETLYFILSEGLGLKAFAEARRKHWKGIESYHFLVDGSFREDSIRLGRKRPESACLMSSLRKKALECIRSLTGTAIPFDEARRELGKLPLSYSFYALSGLGGRVSQG